MTHDYVAILTSVDAGVLLVATIQYGAMLRKAIAHQEAEVLKRQDLIAQMIVARRNGVQPSAADLRAAQRPRALTFRGRRIIPIRLLPWALASGMYIGFCAVLVRSMVRIIKWAGTADGGPAPELAKASFYVTAVALVALIAEAYLLSLASSYRRGKALRRRLTDTYSAQEIDDIGNLIDGTTQVPSSAPASSTPATHP
ncbi:hypothetical protein ABT358_02535 [Streptomyces sp. NPDC000341]|uniref:hypothetical protein n=1 Tax=Streptomyces sp. NPDC000341 TaxID=3156645 RepID=UPI0033185705